MSSLETKTQILMGAPGRYQARDAVLIRDQDGHFFGLQLLADPSAPTLTADLDVVLDAPGSSAALWTLALVPPAQKALVRNRIHHQGSRTRSRQTARALIGGRGLFDYEGRVCLDAGSTGAEAHQVTRSLLLDVAAQSRSRPSLEILHDDVVCTHGATVAPLHGEEIFYLMSRGYPRKDAERLLASSFANALGHELADTPLAPIWHETGPRMIMEFFDRDA